MSLAETKRVLDDFVSNSGSSVVAIRGSWGVGKTYFWKNYISTVFDEQKTSKEKYAYVSLFGLSSLSEVKLELFRSIESPDSESSDDGSTDGSLWQKLGARRRGIKTIEVASSIEAIRSWLPSFDSLGLVGVNDALLCFDDVERISAGLSTLELMGLVNHLKDERNCSVLLILNDEQLREENDLDYADLREKVVDVEILFELEPEEAAALAFEDDPKSSLCEMAVRLGIRNIRILDKLKRASGLLEAFLSEVPEGVKNRVLHSLTLMVWSRYGEREGAPTLEYLKQLGLSMFAPSQYEDAEEEGQPNDSPEAKWRNLLEDYGYSHTDELDLVLAGIVERGYVIEEPLLKCLHERTGLAEKQTGENSLTSAWSLFHNSFDNNEDELVAGLVNSIENNSEFISPLNLDGTVRLLKELGHGDVTDGLIATYVEQNKHRPDVYNLDSAFSSDIQDEDVRNALNTAYEDSYELPLLIDVLSNIAAGTGWNRVDEIVLRGTSVEEFIAGLKNFDEPHKAIRATLRIARHNEENQALLDTFTTALTSMASESALNAARLSRYGIEASPNES